MSDKDLLLKKIKRLERENDRLRKELIHIKLKCKRAAEALKTQIDTPLDLTADGAQ